jgi:hypothetical protein
MGRRTQSSTFQLLSRLRLWGNSRKLGQLGYKGQRRVLQRWKGPLVRMRLAARARGDRAAHIRLTGLLAPGVALGDGSLQVLLLSRAERREARQLQRSSPGKRQATRRERRPQDLYFGLYQGRHLRLLKTRRQTRPMRLRR